MHDLEDYTVGETQALPMETAWQRMVAGNIGFDPVSHYPEGFMLLDLRADDPKDVYKRQSLSHGSQSTCKKRLRLSVSVSYTHLDVYKRQTGNSLRHEYIPLESVVSRGMYFLLCHSDRDRPNFTTKQVI